MTVLQLRRYASRCARAVGLSIPTAERVVNRVLARTLPATKLEHWMGQPRRHLAKSEMMMRDIVHEEIERATLAEGV
jgi:hypothetical protein